MPRALERLLAELLDEGSTPEQARAARIVSALRSDVQDLDQAFSDRISFLERRFDEVVSPVYRDISSIRPLDITEREEIERALSAVGGNVVLAASLLRIGPATIYRRLDRYRRDDAAKRRAGEPLSSAPEATPGCPGSTPGG